MFKNANLKLAILSSSVSRRGGGVYFAINQLSKALIEVGCDLEIFGGIDEYTKIDSVKWDNIHVNEFKCFGPKSFGYQVGLLEKLKEFSPKIVHTHGLWMYPSVASRIWSRSGGAYIVSPHGMLDDWALSNAKYKKKIASCIFERAHVTKASCVHALCDAELLSVRNYGVKAPVAILPNGVCLPVLDGEFADPIWAKDIPQKSKILLYLGRIHHKKGLMNLIEAWAKVKNNNTYSDGDDWVLVIAGWDQNSYINSLKSKVFSFGVNKSVFFVGPQFDEQKDLSFRKASAFILPSLSEGLPVAVLEAWSYAKPVVMTKECNLPEGFEYGAAIKIETSVDGIIDGLNNIFSSKNDHLKIIGYKGRDLVCEKYTWGAVANGMSLLYNWIINGGEPPSFVDFY